MDHPSARAYQANYDPAWTRRRLGQESIPSEMYAAINPDGAGDELRRIALSAEGAAREQAARDAQQLYAAKILTGVGYDFFTAELQDGYLPRIEGRAVYDQTGKRRMRYSIWSSRFRRFFTLREWEEQGQEYLPIDDPDRVTGVLHPEQSDEYQTPPRAWHPRLDSNVCWQPHEPVMRVTPPYELPAIPVPPRAPTSQRLTPQPQPPAKPQQPRQYWPDVNPAIVRALTNLKLTKRERE